MKTIPPTNPITIWINGVLIDGAIRDFARQYLPAYELIITSAYRTAEHNREIGGAQDSAHIYNLARDFTLRNKASGKIVTDTELKTIYEMFITPNWEGFKMYEPKTDKTASAWIHLNLDRVISNNTKFLALAAGTFTAAITAKKIFEYIKNLK